MAKIVDVLKNGELDMDKRQIPLFVDDKLTMVLDVMGADYLCELPKLQGKERDAFIRKFSLLSMEECCQALRVKTKRLLDIVTEIVPCVGCRRSMEHLLANEMSYGALGSWALYPLMVEHDGYIGFAEECFKWPSLIGAMFHNHTRKLNELSLLWSSSRRRCNKSSRCNLHCLDVQRYSAATSRPSTVAPPLPIGLGWRVIWDNMVPFCRLQITTIETSQLLSTLENYLHKHRFCSECKTKVMKAYSLLVDEPKGEESAAPAAVAGTGDTEKCDAPTLEEEKMLLAAMKEMAATPKGKKILKRTATKWRDSRCVSSSSDSSATSGLSTDEDDELKGSLLCAAVAAAATAESIAEDGVPYRQRATNSSSESCKDHHHDGKCKSEASSKTGSNDEDENSDDMYFPTMYAGIKRCPPNAHLHIDHRADFIQDLILTAEPELLGNSRRERHAKTMEMAQEEVLICVGLCLYERIHRMSINFRDHTNTLHLLSLVALNALSTNFQLAVESKQGVSQMELLFQEFSRDDEIKERKKQIKQMKRRRKKAQKKSASLILGGEEYLILDSISMNEDEDDEDEPLRMIEEIKEPTYISGIRRKGRDPDPGWFQQQQKKQQKQLSKRQQKGKKRISKSHSPNPSDKNEPSDTVDKHSDNESRSSSASSTFCIRCEGFVRYSFGGIRTSKRSGAEFMKKRTWPCPDCGRTESDDEKRTRRLNDDEKRTRRLSDETTRKRNAGIFRRKEIGTPAKETSTKSSKKEKNKTADERRTEPTLVTDRRTPTDKGKRSVESDRGKKAAAVAQDCGYGSATEEINASYSSSMDDSSEVACSEGFCNHEGSEECNIESRSGSGSRSSKSDHVCTFSTMDHCYARSITPPSPLAKIKETDTRKKKKEPSEKAKTIEKKLKNNKKEQSQQNKNEDKQKCDVDSALESSKKQRTVKTKTKVKNSYVVQKEVPSVNHEVNCDNKRERTKIENSSRNKNNGENKNNHRNENNRIENKNEKKIGNNIKQENNNKNDYALHESSNENESSNKPNNKPVSSESTTDCSIPVEEIERYRSSAGSILEKRQQLREALRSKFFQLCLNTNS